jgi:hypothetical protein
MERLVMRVLEFGLGETLVVVNRSVANELHLRHAWDGFEIWMKNGFLCLAGLVVSMAVALRERVKSLRVALSVWTLKSSHSESLYLGQSVLFLWRNNDVREEQGIVLIWLERSYGFGICTYLIEQSLDLFKLFWSEFTRMDILDDTRNALATQPLHKPTGNELTVQRNSFWRHRHQEPVEMEQFQWPSYGCY